MAAGLGFKTFNTGDVLSAADVNGYLMQGVLVFADATARDAAITSPQEGQFAYTKDNNSLWYYTGSAWAASGATGDIEGVTAGTGISGGGTSGTVTITNSMATAIDAKGDLVVGTGSDTFSRLAVGTNGYLLTADSAEATGMKWAAAAGGGGMTLINSGNTSLSNVTTLTISSIPSTYKHLYIVGMGIRTTNSYGANLWMRINGDTGSNYKTSRYQVVNNTIGGEGTVSPASAWFLVEINNGTAYNGVSFFELNIPLYSNTSQYKKATTFSGVTAGSDIIQSQMSHSFNSTSAISSLEFYSSVPASTGNFLGDSAVYVYGVN